MMEELKAKFLRLSGGELLNFAFRMISSHFNVHQQKADRVSSPQITQAAACSIHLYDM
jgi:hypothetical protein